MWVCKLFGHKWEQVRNLTTTIIEKKTGVKTLGKPLFCRRCHALCIIDCEKGDIPTFEYTTKRKEE